MGRWLAASFVLISTLLLSGCEESANPSAPSLSLREVEAIQAREFFEGLASCMTEKGFPSTVQEDGAVMVEHGAQGEAWREAEAVCTEELGGWPTSTPLTEQELGQLYDLEVKAYECLVARGLDPLPPSSKEQFVETYLTGESWYAHKPPVAGGSPLPTTDCPQPRLSDIGSA